MARRGHPYRENRAGRALTARPGIGGPTMTAHLTCSQCAADGKVKVRAVMPADQIDQKFKQAGWRLDPHLCPACVPPVRTKKEASPMATATVASAPAAIASTTTPTTAPAAATPVAFKPSPAAMKAQAAMFQMLSEQFDSAAGRYCAGWTDERIAKETGLGIDYVRDFRVAGFGELREPEELTRMRADIEALEALHRETVAEFNQSLTTLRADLARAIKALGR